MTPGRVLLWACSFGGLGFSLAAAWFGPPAVWVVAVVLLAYLAIVLSGVFFPRLGMYATVHCVAPSSVPALALTFDDGPHPQTTPAVLDILEQHEAVATFFVVGHKVDKYPEVVREIVARGHALGLHGYQHERLFALRRPTDVARDIEQTRDAVERACGVRPRAFRPPIGFVSPRTAAGARRAQAPLIGWSVRAYDGTGHVSPERMLRRIEPGLRAGAIVLLHDAAERDDFVPGAVEALPRILEAIQRRGLTTASLERLLGFEPAKSAEAHSSDVGQRALSHADEPGKPLDAS
ncbi:MAG TPA: polysaccharide deacetylase family protein [Polyangiaceae bacterium]